MLLDFELQRAKLMFDKKVLPITKNINPNFNYFFNDFEAVIILEQKPLFFIFLNYIPFGKHTTLATYEDSVSNVLGKPRVSKGEWIVEIVFKCNTEDAEKVLKEIKNAELESNTIIDFIKSELSNF